MTPGNWLTLIGMAAMWIGSYVSSQRANDGKFTSLKESMDEKFATLAVQITEITKGDVRELKTAVAEMKADFREWSTRSHARNNELNVKIGEFTTAFSIRVDRLEQRDAERRETERRDGDRREQDRRES